MKPRDFSTLRGQGDGVIVLLLVFPTAFSQLLHPLDPFRIMFLYTSQVRIPWVTSVFPMILPF